LSQAELDALVDEAHALRRKTAAHAHGAEAAKRAIRAGIDSIEHGTFLDDEALRMMHDKGVFLVPTMATRVGMAESRFPPLVQAKADRAMKQQDAMVKRALAMGVKIALGTDAAVYPHGDNALELVSAVIGTLLAQGATYTVLHRFTGPDGRVPYTSGVIRDLAGNLYGTTLTGGAVTAACPSGCGVVFKLDPTGKETLLYSFTVGDIPQGALIRDWAGNLYGTAGGGSSGVVFKLDPAGKETVLYGFSGGADGGSPLAGVIGDLAGNLYGTTVNGGRYICSTPPFPQAQIDCGVVFTVDPTGKETVLYSFTGGADGASPSAGLFRDWKGNLYGNTQYGGITTGPCVGVPLLFSGCGVVFKLDPTGKETVLYRFTGGADGAYPEAGLIRDRAGNLYGTASTNGGGSTFVCPPSCGVVFKLDPTGKLTVLHTFTGGPDGGGPSAGLIPDREGNLYGTALP
jgi:uncharacterized repeat protein (TIGR03803 family)